MVTANKLKEKRQRKTKSKQVDIPVIQPVMVHNHPVVHWKLWESYHNMIMFTQQWLSMQIEEKGLTKPPFIVLPLKRFYHLDVAFSRSFLAEFSMLNKATHTLYLDSDNTFEPDTIIKLLSHEKRVVSGLYFTHGRTSDVYPMSIRPVMYMYDTEARGGYKHGEHYYYKSVTGWDTTQKLIEVDGCGGGCLLVDNTIFKDLQKHLFEHKGLSDGDITKIPSIRMYFKMTPHHTEDFTFCNHVKEHLKESIYVDPSIMCGHIQEKIVKGKDFLVSKQIEVSSRVGSDEMTKMTAKDIIEFDMSLWDKEHNK